MRRVLGALAVGVVLIAGAFVLQGSGGTSGNARVDAIFDNASFVIPGQDVKIAGAKVGTIKDVKLTDDNKARVEMQIDPSFTPFHADADCTIQPQSLIGEEFVQCTPGTPNAPQLTKENGHAPTVPVANTHAPISLDLLFATFRRPTNQRLSILLNELGSGLAARGADLNQVIRRANPALQETRKVLNVVDGDRANLQRLLTASDHVLGTLSSRRQRIGEFITSARKASETTAQSKRQLGDTVQGLPPLLDQARPSLAALQQVFQQGTPLLQNLRRSAPALSRLANDAGPLADAARPALTNLGTASVSGQRALTAAAPIVRKLDSFAVRAKPTGQLLAQLLSSLKTSGTLEGAQSFIYEATLALSRFDKVSHILPAYLLPLTCGSYATVSSPQCDANFHATPAVRAKHRATTVTHHRAAPHKSAPAQKTTTTAPPAAAPPATTAPTTTTPAPTTTQSKGTTVTLPGGLPPIKLPIGGGSGQPDGDRGSSSNAVKDVLDYLLK